MVTLIGFFVVLLQLAIGSDDIDLKIGAGMTGAAIGNTFIGLISVYYENLTTTLAFASSQAILSIVAIARYYDNNLSYSALASVVSTLLAFDFAHAIWKKNHPNHTLVSRRALYESFKN